MNDARDWSAMENTIASLLAPQGAAPNRAMLLAALSQYANAVVRYARREGALLPRPEAYGLASAWLQVPVFVCGHYRSGTTLMQELLDGHPELLVLPDEGTWFTSFHYVARRNYSDRDLDRFAADWVARLVDPNYEPHFKLGRSTQAVNPSVDFVRSLLGWHSKLVETGDLYAEFSPLLALVAAFRDVAAPTAAPRLWVEKTPLNEIHVDRLAKLPQARFIQLVREPGATLASLLEGNRADIRRSDVAAHAAAIARSMKLARRNERMYPGRYLIVRYEDLASRPDDETERVRTFLGISRHASLMVPTVGGRAVSSNSSFETGAPGVVHRPRVTMLTADKEKLVAAFAARSAAPFGYVGEPVNLLSRSAAHLYHLPSLAWRRSRTEISRLRLRLF